MMEAFDTRIDERDSNRRSESRTWLGLTALVVVLAAWLGPEPQVPLALAYLDPGSGSLIIQAVIAVIAGVAVLLRTYWEKVKSFLGFSPGTPREEQENRAESARDE